MDRFFFEDLQKTHRCSDFPMIFSGLPVKLSLQPILWSFAMKNPPASKSTELPGICWRNGRNAVGSHRTLFLFRPVGSGREKWLRKLPGSCGLLPLRKTTCACRKVHLLNYHYEVWLIRGIFHEIFVDVNGFYQPRPLKCPSQWLCQPCV